MMHVFAHRELTEPVSCHAIAPIFFSSRMIWFWFFFFTLRQIKYNAIALECKRFSNGRHWNALNFFFFLLWDNIHKYVRIGCDWLARLNPFYWSRKRKIYKSKFNNISQFPHKNNSIPSKSEETLWMFHMNYLYK